MDFQSRKTLLQRLSTQHRMWKLLVGGLYPPALQAPVAKALGGATPIILDAGCGSAAWFVNRNLVSGVNLYCRPAEMAELFPSAHVVGVDLAVHFEK
jgi:hypothetical protein